MNFWIIVILIKIRKQQFRWVHTTRKSQFCIQYFFFIFLQNNVETCTADVGIITARACVKHKTSFWGSARYYVEHAVCLHLTFNKKYFKHWEIIYIWDIYIFKRKIVNLFEVQLLSQQLFFKKVCKKSALKCEVSFTLKSLVENIVNSNVQFR